MAAESKIAAAHVENAQHEAVLTGVVALAGLFSSCVEAFNLIHPSPKWAKDEQLLMTRLGLQQARLLIWGDVTGICSPPATVTDRAVPKHPSSAYPDLSEPTFFQPRDMRLEETDIRTTVEQALSALVDRSSTNTRDEMMAKYGLKAPKRSFFRFEPALDTSRLEAFRERWELLREVAESYAQINTRRNNSIIHSSWMIADTAKFSSYVDLTKSKVDQLIELLDVKEQVDRAMSMDIHALGWHLTNDRGRVAMDVSKLRLLREISRKDYPEYVPAIHKALDNIGREGREYAGLSPLPQPAPAPTGGAADTSRRPGIMKLFRSFGKSRDTHQRSTSLSNPVTNEFDSEPQRAKSDAGLPYAEPAPMARIRSKSIGTYIDPPTSSLDEELMRIETEKLKVREMPTEEPLPLKIASPEIIRHDQYHGIARTNTRDLHQADY